MKCCSFHLKGKEFVLSALVGVSHCCWPIAASLICVKIFSLPLIPSFLSLPCELVIAWALPGKSRAQILTRKRSPCWLPQTLGRGLCTPPAFRFRVLISVCKNICSHALDGVQCAHPWPPSVHLHRKTVSCCFLHAHKLLPATPPLHRALQTPANPGGRGDRPTHQGLRARKTELCESHLLRGLQTIHKSTITPQRKPWH